MAHTPGCSGMGAQQLSWYMLALEQQSCVLLCLLQTKDMHQSIKP
jgi:hypothetical protein